MRRRGRRGVSSRAPNGIDDGVDVVIRQQRVDRQRDLALVFARRDRERVAAVAEAIAIEGMEMERNEMHARADAGSAQRLDELAAIDAVQSQCIEMPGVIFRRIEWRDL